MHLRRIILLLLGIAAIGVIFAVWQRVQAFQQGLWPIEQEHLPAGVPPGYAKRWLTGNPCAVPCWEGVTPGHTTVADAIKILNQNPGIIAGSVITDTWSEAKLGYVTWKWVGSDHGGEALYDLETAPPTITLIRPFYEYLSGAAPSFALEEVIQHYGEPSHIIAHGFNGLHGDGPFYKVTIIYAQQGISFEQRGLYHVKPILSPSMRFDRVFFQPLPFDPSLYSDVWQGFKSFDAYCRGAPDDRAQSACPSRQ